MTYIAAALAIAAAALLSSRSAAGTTAYPRIAAVHSMLDLTATSTSSTAKLPPIHTVGEITWHAKGYLGTDVRIRGYLLGKEGGDGILSDEKTGSITPHDLLVTGPGVANMQLGQKFILEGLLIANTRLSIGRTLYILEVSSALKDS